ncbi:MAG: tripartite tricarboxylate transporter permease, partial [Pseudomonadota bacterium]
IISAPNSAAAGGEPGVGEDVAGWVSYGVGRNLSREPESFGKGSFDGLLSSETANNACIGGALIPLLVLGIPGSPPAAALLGALMINNVTPGPTIDPALVMRIVAILVMCSLAILLMGFVFARVFVSALKLPQTLFLPIILVLTTIGSFSVGGGINDLYIMLVIGLVAYAAGKAHFPIAPMVIGVILGGLFDESLRRALLVSDGSLTMFVTRPVSLVLLVLIAMLTLSQIPIIRRVGARLAANRA